MSNVGKWNYSKLSRAKPYGDTQTYRIGAEYLRDLTAIEDWGCGRGYLSTYIQKGKYRGIDGSNSIFCDAIVDLESYQSKVPGIFMRHVLEHNWNWKKVLSNALQSFQQKICVVLFTPWGLETKNIANDYRKIDVPDLSFNRDEFLEVFNSNNLSTSTIENIKTKTLYGIEHVIFANK
jgi:hypothetical protein